MFRYWLAAQKRHVDTRQHLNDIVELHDPDKEKRSAESISILALGIALKPSYVVTDPDINEKREYSTNVPIAHVPCNYGGVRPYFTCPDCHRGF